MIYFVGAGPGDPELLTLKAKRLIDGADVIVYAGSLVNPAVLKDKKTGAMVYDSAGMSLDEVMEVLIEAEERNLLSVRVHTGDPAVYGAIREQIDQLEKRKIAYEVVPGVSSIFAASATLGRELTLPGVSQTVILTRQAGRTPVPEGETISSLAAHRATMVIFLSVGQIDSLSEDLIAGGYAPSTPVAVVYRASWPDEKIVYGTLRTIAELTKEQGIVRQALVMVGEFLGEEYELSKLYDAQFTHGYRKGSDAEPAR
ncbi:MAG: precorrin-4 C(11)-methyltransferase [Fastidiosipilaceae bacterium]|jgi:precorrin-4/cobalt-precorrin-4 C11-methyltransferase